MLSYILNVILYLFWFVSPDVFTTHGAEGRRTIIMWSSWWIVAGDPAEVIGVGINHGTFVAPRKEDVTIAQDDTLVCKVRE